MIRKHLLQAALCFYLFLCMSCSSKDTKEVASDAPLESDSALEHDGQSEETPRCSLLPLGECFQDIEAECHSDSQSVMQEEAQPSSSAEVSGDIEISWSRNTVCEGIVSGVDSNSESFAMVSMEFNGEMRDVLIATLDRSWGMGLLATKAISLIDADTGAVLDCVSLFPLYQSRYIEQLLVHAPSADIYYLYKDLERHSYGVGKASLTEKKEVFSVDIGESQTSFEIYLGPMGSIAVTSASCGTLFLSPDDGKVRGRLVESEGEQCYGRSEFSQTSEGEWLVSTGSGVFSIEDCELSSQKISVEGKRAFVLGKYTLLEDLETRKKEVHHESGGSWSAAQCGDWFALLEDGRLVCAKEEKAHKRIVASVTFFPMQPEESQKTKYYEIMESEGVDVLGFIAGDDRVVMSLYSSNYPEEDEGIVLVFELESLENSSSTPKSIRLPGEGFSIRSQKFGSPLVTRSGTMIVAIKGMYFGIENGVSSMARTSNPYFHLGRPSEGGRERRGTVFISESQ